MRIASSVARRLAVILTLIVWTPAVPALSESPKPVEVGWVERVCLCPGGFIIPAKVDTGAVSCSLHAPDIHEYDRDGKKWVRFHLNDFQGKERTIEQPVVGKRRIKRHFGGYQERMVIRLQVCLGTYCKDVDVNLVDRTGFEFPMLIGRNFMEGSLVVNPSAKNTVEPVCSDTQPDGTR
jgi:hypothetical protein